ncbi:IS30 family transposase, partial [Kitasatospora aureofaciens]
MQQGYSNKEACRIVGIDERTGQKWRNGRKPTGTQRTALLPLTAVAEPSSGPSRYLREDERIHIA